jgi:hypothetical protein
MIRLRHLPDLLVERHAAEEVIDALLDRQRPVPVGWRLILLLLHGHR